MIQFRDVILPLFAMRLKNGRLPDDPRDIRYAGMSFHFNDIGNIATCAHIVNTLEEDESLVGVEMHGECLSYLVKDIQVHPKYDFALGKVTRKAYKALPIYSGPELFIGTDVFAYGMTTAGLANGRIEQMPRLFKGHVVRTHPLPSISVARSTCEISFPSHNGFSGAPLLLANTAVVAGMLYGNHESTITLHKFSEVDSAGTRFSEEIHRVVELGAAHTAADIRLCLDDLGVKRVALHEPA